eukprot:CAMPEP_0185578566 /NCGR_PEP_ID=MMETSP0434-20130131/13011_1 /TAXON_ID=626734 ORGANISM="Favella taraikaensis, Strain Fe Narragansett Bay" /NCGR_SAMPLE_ID=MMETSP0434 /ASSEMBLY_ACC=CAM_ASM_000379 /LENGTH=153 /DNA_ID=CAMNT_0028196397 /DNA_START=18 /DNA_END=479 /DNA_ORIENTATION=-
MDDKAVGSYLFPTTAQLNALASFNISNVSKTDASFSNLVGMYGPTTTNGATAYALWLQFIPEFFSDAIKTPATVGEVNETGATWCNFLKEQTNMTYRILFQMGDEFSDWEGVYYTFTAGTRVKNVSTSIDYVNMSKMTTSNNQMLSAVDQFFT